MKKFLLAVMALVLACGIGFAAVGCNSNEPADAIHVFVREDGSGTRDAFEEKFGIENLKGEVDTHQSTSAMMNAVAGDEYAIGYVSLGSINSTVKALTIGGEVASKDNVYANINNESEGYAYWRYFNVAYKQATMDTNVLLADFFEYIMSQDAQTAIEEENYFSTVGDHAAYTPDPQIASLTGDAAVLDVGGSSSVHPLMLVLAEDYKALHSNVTINVEQLDSTAGATGANDGTFDLGMLSRELKTEEAANLVGAHIAVDGIAIVVNNANTVADLTAAQVKDIFEGKITAWSEITGEAE